MRLIEQYTADLFVLFRSDKFLLLARLIFYQSLSKRFLTQRLEITTASITANRILGDIFARNRIVLFLSHR